MNSKPFKLLIVIPTLTVASLGALVTLSKYISKLYNIINKIFPVDASEIWIWVAFALYAYFMHTTIKMVMKRIDRVIKESDEDLNEIRKDMVTMRSESDVYLEAETKAVRKEMNHMHKSIKEEFEHDLDITIKPIKEDLKLIKPHMFKK